MLQQGFGIQSLDGSIALIAKTRDILEQVMEKEPLLALGSEIIEMEINTDEITEKGLAIQDQIRELWEEQRITKLHFDKQPGWFKLSPDERAQFIFDMLTMDMSEMTPVDFDD